MHAGLLKKMDDEAIKRWGSRNKIILALFGILFVVAIVAGIAHEAGVQEGIRIASTPGFWDQVANVPLGSIIKLVILLICIGYCVGKIIHG